MSGAPNHPRPRRPLRLPLLLAGLALLPMLRGARAQSEPRLGYVYPAGGQRGATFQATLGGQFLHGATNVLISGPGVRARIVDYTRPLTQKEVNDLREKLRELQEQRTNAARAKPSRDAGSEAARGAIVWTPADAKLVAEIRRKLANAPTRQANPALAETVTVELTLAADAEPGERELRLLTATGLSNPRAFEIGVLPEVAAPPTKVRPEPLRPQAARGGERAGSEPGRAERRITLPVVLNGQIMPGAVDRYRFTAVPGQRIVVSARARQLIPYLPDAVPGWFQAVLALYDAKGREVAYVDDYRFNPDPILCARIPAAGECVLEIKDAIYRGRDDFVYRIAIGELPFITSIFPLGGPGGATTVVELEGWNLPATTLTLDHRDGQPGIAAVSVGDQERPSNQVPFAVGTLPEGRETEPNDALAQAQRVTLPIVLNGRIERADDADRFAFNGRAGDALVAEVVARRLNSPLDAVLRLADAAGRQLAFNDDHEDKGEGLATHHADAYLCAVLPADGLYVVHLSDAQRQGGAEYGYRLRLSAPQPDFELRLVPASLTVRDGTSAPLTVYALRKDGMTNEIALALKDPPPGVTLNGGRIPAHQNQVRITLTARADAGAEPLNLGLEGRTTINGRALVRTAVPAEDMMQAFAYRHLVPARELRVAVVGRGPPRPPLRLLGVSPVKIPAGGTMAVRVDVPARAFTGRFQLELSDPPEGVSIQAVRPARDGTEIVFQSDAAKLKPGLEGNLIVSLVPGGSAPARRPAAGQRRQAVGCLPAIPFEIVAP